MTVAVALSLNNRLLSSALIFDRLRLLSLSIIPKNSNSTNLFTHIQNPPQLPQPWPLTTSLSCSPSASLNSCSPS